MNLNNIRDNKNSTKNRKRIGRGIGSGTGKTPGQGQEGQKARSGVAIKGFEGGQMPIHRRLPKRGFVNIFRKNFVEINIEKIENLIKSKKIDPNNIIDAAILFETGLIKKIDDKTKLLSKGEVLSKIKIKVSASSKSAMTNIIEKGGNVEFDEKKKIIKKNKKLTKVSEGN